MPEQPQRDFPFDRRTFGVSAQQGDSILEILLVAARGHEFQDCTAVLLESHQLQSSRLSHFAGISPME